MKNTILLLLLLCAGIGSAAQINYVKNGDFEAYQPCPDTPRRVYYAKNWFNGTYLPNNGKGIVQYNNRCSNAIPGVDMRLPIPYGGDFYQEPHSKDGMITVAVMYYDYFIPSKLLYPSAPSIYSYTFRGQLFKTLTAGKSYCVTFYVNNGEAAGYAHNKIGAYLDDGSIQFLIDTLNKGITSVTPQVYTDSVILDTMNWVKIEGTFVAKGDESSITIGNFFPNSEVTAVVTNYYHVYEHESIYLIDDVSVVALDTKANAGPDRWVSIGNSIEIGPVEDSSARGMDCKWYYKGKLIDSGNVIRVNAASSINQIDTYVVVQNVCGTSTRDTMLLKTAALGMQHADLLNQNFILYPNPSNGNITISCTKIPQQAISAKVYDLLGRIVYEAQLDFSHKSATLKLNLPSAAYIIKLIDENGKIHRERITID